jgi:hypothetical protein
MPFDLTEVLAAIAPRPAFVSAPMKDDNFPVAGVKDCAAAAGPVYDLLRARDLLVFTYPDCGHDFPVEVRQDRLRMARSAAGALIPQAEVVPMYRTRTESECPVRICSLHAFSRYAGRSPKPR